MGSEYVARQLRWRRHRGVISNMLMGKGTSVGAGDEEGCGSTSKTGMIDSRND